MNKQLLIVLLAVCLVSTHAFVKRDVPTAADFQAQVDEAKTNFNDLINKLTKEIQEAVDSEKIKAKFNELVDFSKKTLDSITIAPPTGGNKPAA